MNQERDVTVRQATISDLDLVVPLFDAYRQFYGKPGDAALARQFLLERFQNSQSIIFLAVRKDGSAVGFTQLYPSFSSVSAARIFVLNDLFVRADVRRLKVGRLLLQAAADFARLVGAARLTLSTGVGNVAAQTLYEGEGWKRQDDFYVYELGVEGKRGSGAGGGL